MYVNGSVYQCLVLRMFRPDAVPTANMGKLREKDLDKQTPVSIIVSKIASGVAAKT